MLVYESLCKRVRVRDSSYKSDVQCLYKFPRCPSDSPLQGCISSRCGYGGDDSSSWVLEGDQTGRKQSGRIGICVMSLPRKPEVFLQLGQSTHPWLSAALDGLSGDIGRLCGCISLREIHIYEKTRTAFMKKFGHVLPDCVASSGTAPISLPGV